jgi:SH3-like domain-containing protein
MVRPTMISESLRASVLAVVLCALTAPALADPPHFASIRRDQAFLREGPSYAHRVLWVYHRKNYPVKILDTFDAWRRVKDVDGTVGWMHHTQLSDARTIVFIGFTQTPLHAKADPSSPPVAFAKRGVVAKLKSCEPRLCEVETSGVTGWVDKKNIWGVELGEVF